MKRFGPWLALTAFLLVLGTFAAPLTRRALVGSRCAISPAMVALPPGIGMIGEDGAGNPGHATFVPAFRIDRTEVTNRSFARFVAETNYVTDAERQGGAAVFVAPRTLGDGIDDPRQWWRLVRGASWRHPRGTAEGLGDHWDEPVVDVTFRDAQAYATWRHGWVPTEIQWEYAARGGDRRPHDPADWSGIEHEHPAANVWEGIFPLYDSKDDGFAGLAPVGCFPANGFGLYDMIGNAWEWTREGNHAAALRGGSFLCSENYCANYRPAGRQIQEAGLPSSHAGFRLVGNDKTDEP